MSSRPANGRFLLDQPYNNNADFIPATPGFPGPTKVSQVTSRFLDFKGINPNEGWQPSFDRDTKTLLIDARRNTVDAGEFNALLAQMRAEHDGVNRVVLLVSQGTLIEQGMAEFTHNGFEPEGYVASGQFRLVQRKPHQWETRKPKKLTVEEQAARIKERAMKERD